LAGEKMKSGNSPDALLTRTPACTRLSFRILVCAKLLVQRLTEGEVHDQGHNFDPKATACETQQNLEDFYR
jgi:hypothetical protein